MAITTLKGHVARAIDFYDKDDIYFVIGHTEAWDDEENPPVPKNTDEIEDPAGYKKAESKFLCRPARDEEHGEITYRGGSWKIIDREQALEEGARWVYVMSYIAYEEFSTDIVYRQIGLITGLKPTGGKETEPALQPEDVENEGLLEVIDNREPVYRGIDQREQLSIIREF